MILYPEDLIQTLEFDRIRDRIADNCRCETSREMAQKLAPIEDRMLLLKELVRTEEYLETLRNQGYFPDFLFDDFLHESSLLAKRGSVLSENQFDRLRSANRIVNDLLKYLNDRKIVYPALLELAGDLVQDTAISEMIDEVIDNQCQVRNNASIELSKIRNELYGKRREADKRFRTYIGDLRKKGWLRENEENYHNNRRVLAVPSEHKRDIRGIIHGKSETGKTTFIEPEGLIELNNEVAELELDERNEVLRLLRELTDRLRNHAANILEHHRFLSAMDLVRAKAILARDTDSRLPRIEPTTEIHLVNAFHPLLLLQNKSAGKATIPMNISLDSENRLIIISGPNAGGKSIALKTTGLLQLMLQSGLPVPVGEGSRMGFFDQLLADIGDSQSIEYALSTYSSRLIRMNRFLRYSNSKSIILIDEFGTGTDPELGGAIAEVVLEEINRRKAFGVFTTHYTNIKLLADHLTGVRNASMLFDPETLKPLYRLSVGQPGSSYTFEVAERIGLPLHVLDRAKKKVQRDKIKLNTMLGALQKEKHKLEKEIATALERRHRTEAAETRFEQLSQKLADRIDREKVKQEENRQLLDLGRKMKALAEEWSVSKDRKAVIGKFVATMTSEKKRKALENSAERLAQKREELLQKLRREIIVGSEVRMLKSKQTGIVKEIRKDNVLVDFGQLQVQVALENLESAEESHKNKRSVKSGEIRPLEGY
ncbi:MAG: endonuclease MutS2 [Bacteroidota bacterium]